MTVPQSARREIVGVLVRERDLLGVARRHTYCPEDAQEALQNTAEIALMRMPVDTPLHARRWFKVVLRHECWRVKRQTDRVLPSTCLPGQSDWFRPLDLLEGLEDLAVPIEAAELLRAIGQLKDNERNALLDLFAGYSYQEIMSRRGWTFTKVNRCLAEGRQKLREVFG
jgi:DNA-directed RNA polymerase specialized sigma24 family protein